MAVNRLEVRKYGGDRNLMSLLAESGCGLPVSFIKAAVLGAQSSAEDFHLDTVLREMRGQCGVVIRDGELSRELEGLWYHLYRADRFAENDCESIEAKSPDRGECVEFVARQVEAGDEFMKFLHHGRIDDFFHSERLKKIYAVFGGNLEILRAMKTGMSESWKEEDFNDTGPLALKINSFVRVFWDSMAAIKNIVKSEKLARAKNRTIISDLESRMGQAVRRNDPCPCGSGKKYKTCCGKA